MGIARELFHAVSAVDGNRQPYLLCSHEGRRLDDPVSVIVVLHDRLELPTADGFVEDAFRQAHRYAPLLETLPHACLLFPYGRGNSGWIGRGGAAVFDALADARQRTGRALDNVSLLGTGMGGTGALLLACWHPDRFSAVAAIAACADPKAVLPPGCSRWNAWERSQRKQLSVYRHAANLRRLPVRLEHPWWIVGGDAATTRDQAENLARRLELLGGSVRLLPEDDDFWRRESPRDAAALFSWLTSQNRSTPERFEYRTRSMLARRCHWLCLDAVTAPGKLSEIQAELEHGTARVTTKRVGALSIDRSQIPGPLRAIEIDGRPIEIDDAASDPILRLERLADDWQTVDPGEPDAPFLTGLDLHFGRPLFVYGTIGDERTTIATKTLAERLARAMRTGADSLNVHPGDRRCDFEFPILSDAELTDEHLTDFDAVLIGCPRSNLAVARLPGLPGVEWSAPGESAAFRTKKTVYDAPDAAFAHFADNPLAPGRLLLALSGNSPECYDRLGRLTTAFLPSRVVLVGSDVAEWGHAPAR